MSRDDSPRCVIYARVSPQQGDKTMSLELQIKEASRWVAYRKGKLVATPYVDEKVSGRTQDRPALNAMMSELAELRVDYVVVYTITRLGRNAKGILESMEAIREMGGEIFSTREGIDSSNPTMRFQFTLLSGLAELEVEQLRERTRDGLRYRKEQGVKLGSAPVGYRAVASGPRGRRERKFVAAPEEQAGLKRGLELHRSGMGYREIAGLLNSEFPRADGKKWSKSVLHRRFRED